MKKQIISERLVMGFFYIILVFALIVLFFSIKTIFFTGNNMIITQTGQANQMSKLSRMGLTSYDKQLAIKLMDKDNDGKCDACGMDVNICIESGQLQCNMDSKSTIGILGTQHIHADWKIYINGKNLDSNFLETISMDMSRTDSDITSSFIHVDSGAPAPEKTGDILHMHATGVPLWVFFESIDLKLSNGMNAYVNGKLIEDYKNYVFNDLDKILITDGAGDLQEQLNSITDFSEIH